MEKHYYFDLAAANKSQRERKEWGQREKEQHVDLQHDLVALLLCSIYKEQDWNVRGAAAREKSN